MKARTLGTPLQGMWVILMSASFIVVKRAISLGKWFLLMGMMAVPCLTVQAESGSTQAVMALIVPPHDEAVSSTVAQPDPATWKQPYYDHEARVQITEKVGAHARQVWVTF